jgi:hypothetical protein
MSYTVDPELIKLMSAAKQGNKNLSGTLDNLTNPLFTYAAGVYDPLAAQGGDSVGGGGPLWSQYAGETNPIMRDLMTKIQNGTNKFYLGSYIDSLNPADVQATGYSPSDLKGLASGLLKEYNDGASSSSGSKASKDPFAKGNAAGLRNPLDLYSTSEMPVGKRGAAGLNKISKEQQAVMSALQQAQTAAVSAQSSLGSLFNGFDERGRAKAPSVQQMMSYVSGNQELQKQLPFGSMRQVDPATGDIYEARGTQEQKGYSNLDPRNLLNLINIPAKEVFRTIEQVGNSAKGKQQPNIRDLVASRVPTEENILKVKKAKRREGLATGQANAAAAEAELYKKGMLRALAETGRTPLGDQMKTLLQFAALSK